MFIPNIVERVPTMCYNKRLVINERITGTVYTHYRVSIVV